MTPFWRGFIKKAGEPDLIEALKKEVKEEEGRLKKDRLTSGKYDPRELSEWRGPEEWFRGNP